MKAIALSISGCLIAAFFLAGCASPEQLDARLDERHAATEHVRGRWDVRAQREDQRQEDIFDAMFHNESTN